MAKRLYSEIHERQLFSFSQAHASSAVIIARSVEGKLSDPRQAIKFGSSILLLGFALELSIKCLLAIENRQIAKDHDLEKLIGLLRATDKKRIRSLYRKKLTTNPEIRASKKNAARIFGHGLSLTFNKALCLSANAFMAARYPWDAPNKSVKWHAGPILNCVTDRIIELRPSFSELKLLN